MKVGDLAKDTIDDDYYIIIGEEIWGSEGGEFKVYRISDEHIDTRYRDELEVVCK